MTADDRGFALIETLVALTIAATTLAVLFQLFSTDLRSVERADAYAHATLLAESRLESIGVAEPLMAGTLAGRFDDRFSWSVAIERFAPDDDRAAQAKSVLFKVRVTVLWRDGHAGSAVSLDTLRMAPIAGGAT
jgi:general secretion pathway protein I